MQRKRVKRKVERSNCNVIMFINISARLSQLNLKKIHEICDKTMFLELAKMPYQEFKIKKERKNYARPFDSFAILVYQLYVISRGC